MTTRSAFLLLLLAAGCNQPKPGGDRALIGSFVSANISGQANDIELRGQLHWHATIQGSANGITLRGSLR